VTCIPLYKFPSISTGAFWDNTITKLFYFLRIFSFAYFRNHLSCVQTYKPALLKALYQLQGVHTGGMGAAKESRELKSCAEELSRQAITMDNAYHSQHAVVKVVIKEWLISYRLVISLVCLLQMHPPLAVTLQACQVLIREGVTVYSYLYSTMG